MRTTLEIMQAAKRACPILMTTSEEQKNAALHAMADQLVAQQAEILALGVNIFFDLSDQLLNGHISSFRAVKPVTGSCFAHAHHFSQSINDIVLKERECITGLLPTFTVELLKLRLKSIDFSGFFNELL